MKAQIKQIFSEYSGGNLKECAQRLLDLLGYQSDKTHDLTCSVSEFIAHNRDTNSKEEFIENGKSVDIIYQVTKREITRSGFDGRSFDERNSKSFIFIAVDLIENTYSRGQYARFTREINKRCPMPAAVFFKTNSGYISLAFIYRRLAQTKDSDVLEKVSLIREINPDKPHAAHLSILSELALEKRLSWMTEHDMQHDFDGLLKAWLSTLDTEALNRRFYQALFAWFERVIHQASFPFNDLQKKQEQTIRLITRLLFIWFIKEKSLVSDKLFNENEVKRLIKNYTRENSDSYYRVVLQNLFFATLNTKIDKRGFAQRRNKSAHYYCYRNEMEYPSELLELFSVTPFINGSLFDCLDTDSVDNANSKYIDCFSDNRNIYRNYFVSNHLFFDEREGLIPLLEHYKFTVEENTPTDQEVALDPELLGKVFENLLAVHNPETQDTARNMTGSFYTPRPVVDYMVDWALVEVLMQKLGPESDEACRQKLHDLLDYSKDYESEAVALREHQKKDLVEYIASIKILDPAVGSGAFPMSVLHKLTLALRRVDPKNELWEREQKRLAKEKASAAFNTPDPQERNQELTAISDTFERYRDSDFGRKLYLIQNSIFGVDFQPIACQIARLRFFISLAIEQDYECGAENHGIRPLPNLETRFVAADTLGLPLKFGQGNLQSDEVVKLKRKLNQNRENYFHADGAQGKLACRKKDKKIRAQLLAYLVKGTDLDMSFIDAKELAVKCIRGTLNIHEIDGLPSAAAKDAEKLADWDPYDQNMRANWFDEEYMLGVGQNFKAEGFDIVIGNPPYIQLQKDGGRLRRLYENSNFETFAASGDVYQLFYERGYNLLAPGRGILAYITSNSWLKTEYGKSTRQYFSKKHAPIRLLEMGKDVFENAVVDTNILIAQSEREDWACKAVDMDRLQDDKKDFPPKENLWVDFHAEDQKPWSILSEIEQNIMRKMTSRGVPLKEWDISINYGIKTGYNSAFIIDDTTRNELVRQSPKSAEIIKPILRGRDIQRYHANWANIWLIDTHNGYGVIPAVNIENYPAVKQHLDQFYPHLDNRQDQGVTPYNLRNCAYHEEFLGEKLFWKHLVEQARGRVAYAAKEIYCNNATYLITGEALKYLCIILNSKLIGWYMGQTAATTGTGDVQWSKFAVGEIPIPRISQSMNFPDEIFTGHTRNIEKLEAEIEHFVCQCYGLNSKEIKTLESIYAR